MKEYAKEDVQQLASAPVDSHAPITAKLHVIPNVEMDVQQAVRMDVRDARLHVYQDVKDRLSLQLVLDVLLMADVIPIARTIVVLLVLTKDVVHSVVLELLEPALLPAV